MFKRERLNNKGFTLVELLAVIVILALVVGITVPSVLSSMNSSRVSTLHTTSVSVANWYNETVAEDELLSNKTIPVALVQTLITNAGGWTCLVNAGNEFGLDTDSVVNLAEAYGLSESNFNLSGSAPSNDTNGDPVVSSDTCSAIRADADGKIEILIVAATSGRYNVNSYVVTYALSSADNGCTGASDTCEGYTNGTTE